MTQARDDSRHRGVHESGAGARQDARQANATSGRSGACSTKCSPARAHLPVTTCRKCWRRCWRGSRTGPGFLPICRPRSARTSDAVWRRIRNNELQTPRICVWHWRVRLTPLRCRPHPSSRRALRARAVIGALVVGAAVAGAVVWVVTRPPARLPPHVSRLQIVPSGAAALTITGETRDLAITPDGSRVVYVGNRGTQLLVRAMDSLDPVAVFTRLPRGPFVSPDGKWTAFADAGELKKVPVSGGPAVPITTIEVPPPAAPHGDRTTPSSSRRPTEPPVCSESRRRVGPRQF